ncbi:MAG TPA: trypsin-like peptidase domain-containing protein [Chloroflexota bacterium]|nr:trypsin-like peptidase domain-containing protein [Chloroflexota bacterium]
MRSLLSLTHVRREIALALWAGFLAGVLASCVAIGGSPAAHQQASIASTNAPVPGSSEEQLQEQSVTKVSPAIVKVTNVGVGLGSGVILTKNGYIVTNNHVVAQASSLTVTLADNRTLSAHLVGTDPIDDLAVVKVNAANLPTATLGDSSRLVVGETVLAIGNPIGYTRTATIGIVSALNRTVQEGQNSRASIPNAIQTSAPINPGNSGGALINLGGQVVGIPTLAAIDPEFGTTANGIGFAIPSNTVARIAPQLIKYGKVIHSGRPAIGVYVEDVDAQLAAAYNLPISHGVLVIKDTPGGGAAKAGIKPYDIIIAVNGQATSSESALLDVLAQHQPGQSVSVTVVTKGGQHRTYRVKLGELAVNGG